MGLTQILKLDAPPDVQVFCFCCASKTSEVIALKATGGCFRLRSGFLPSRPWIRLKTRWVMGLVAPYCAIPRDYLSDTPLLRAMGFLVSQHGQLGAIPPPPFLSVPPLRTREVEVRYPPLKRGISAILARYPMKTRQMGAIPPSAILSRKGIARYGGVSRTGPLR